MDDKELSRRAAKKAAEEWESHHYRVHSGAFEECSSKACIHAVTILTDPDKER